MDTLLVIPDFPDYSVSNMGYVVNDVTGRRLKNLVTQRGIYVGLTRDGIQHNRMLSRLVAEAFLPRPEDFDMHITFDTPINLNGDRTQNCVTNLMWRPRWFAQKYHHQFHKVWSSSRRVMDVDTDQRFPTAMDAAMKFGLLALDVFEWALMYDYYMDRSVPGVWPTGQRFRFAHNAARRDRRI